MLYKNLFIESQRLPSTLSWRERQLSWFAEPVVIKQDQQLIEYMHQTKVQQAMIYGDNFFSQFVDTVEHGPVDFIIWIQNTPYEFDKLVDELNKNIASNLCKNGILYLALNKFLGSGPQHRHLPDNYNSAIRQYLTDSVDAVIEKSFFDCNSVGSMFNWVHPLTRFYFKK